MELKFLGTSAATPTKNRNLPSFALKLDSGDIVLFDAGEDVQRRFEAAKLKFNVPMTIFISHMHGDHIIGLPGLLFTFLLNGRTAPLSIIGPQGIASYLIAHFQIIGLQANTYELTVKEISIKKNPDDKEELVCYTKFLTSKYERKIWNIDNSIIKDSQKFIVKYWWMNHSIPTFGFRFEEKARNGKFNPQRADELDIDKGLHWKNLQNGEIITTKDGRTIDPIKMGIVSEKRPGIIIAYSGDTTICDNLGEISSNADYFICESTYATEHEHLAIEKKHMSSKMAATIAKESNVRYLILTHFSSRYKDTKTIENEAKSIFPNTIVASDLLTIEIKHMN